MTMSGANVGIFIALGSNLGDRAANLRAALECLAQSGEIRLRRCSSVHETEPSGGPAGQGKYLNAAAEVATELPPRGLLARLLAVETALGRVRRERDGPRTIDLDLLVYHRERIDEPGLVVPHPRMWRRSFVLEPLAELCDVAALRRELEVEPAHAD